MLKFILFNAMLLTSYDNTITLVSTRNNGKKHFLPIPLQAAGR
ncbi:MAG: hypothetical protein H6Q93_1569 [Nitrospirae bacterium]|jgi:hypothetical protein|nr:hypothetical protein [Nitrospirota bacterium]MBS1127580.1 hypothetical protein [Nitrospirota bacterium]